MSIIGLLILLLSNVCQAPSQSVTDFKRACLDLHRPSTYLTGSCIVLHEGNAKTREDASTQCNTDYTNGHLATVYNKAHIHKIAVLLDLTMSAWCDLKRDKNDTNAWLHTPSGALYELFDNQHRLIIFVKYAPDVGPKPKANDPPWDPSIANNPTLIGDGVIVGENGFSNEDETQIHPFLCQFDEPTSDPTEYNKRKDGLRASNDDAFNAWTVENIFVCADNCDQMRECRSFAFSAASSECHLYSIPSEALSLSSHINYELFDKISKDNDCLSKDHCSPENTHFLLIGGTGYSNIEEIYPLNPSQNAIVATISQDRTNCLAEWYDGKVLIMGGLYELSTVLFDPDSRASSPVADMPGPPRIKAASATFHGAVVVCGGYENLGENVGDNMASCIKFQNNQWSSNMPSLNRKRRSLAMITFNQKIYTVGGIEATHSAIVERFDPDSNVWTIMSSFPTVHAELTRSAVFQDAIFMCGGYGPGDSATDQCFKYNEADDQWLEIGSMNIKRTDSHLLVFNGYLYVVTGLDKDWNPLATLEVYDHVSDVWNITGVNKVEAGRAYFAAVVV